MLAKRLLVPLALLAALVVNPARAVATGTYTVHTCKTPTGTFTGNGGWTSATSLAVPGQSPAVAVACRRPGESLKLQFDIDPVAPMQWGRWTFTAPSKTYITSVSLDRWLQLGWPVVPGSYGRPYVYDAWHDGDVAENQLEFEIPPYGGDASGDDFALSLNAGRVSWSSLSVRLSCWNLIGSLDCGPFPAQVAVSRAAIGMTDTEVPAGSQTGGTLASADPVRGLARLTVHATDAGAGVYRAALKIDGDELARTVLDDAGGSCRDVEPSNEDPYEFGAPQPCPLATDGLVQLDTATLRDGQHTVHVTVEDAGGNEAVVYEGIVRTHNAPINTLAPALVGQPGVGSQLTVNSGQWDGAPTAYDHRWLRCEADGSDCTAVAGATGPTYTPSDADAYHRLQAEVTAANGSGSSSARTAPSALVADAAGHTAPPSAQGASGAGGGGASGGSGTTPPPGSGPGIVNPLGQLPGHVANGANATTHARLTVAFQRADGTTARTVRSRHGRRLAIVGRLTDASGAGVAGARVGASWRTARRGWAARPGARTGPDGRFVYLLPAGPSRDVRFSYFAYSDGGVVALSNVVHVDVLAPLTIHADRMRITGDRVVRLSGRVGGAPIPRAGLLVTLEGFQQGWGWRAFRTVRTDRHGSWSTRYRFRLSAGRFGFRALLPHQARFPFATSRSAGVFVVLS